MLSFKSVSFLLSLFIVSCNQIDTDRMDLKKADWVLQSHPDSLLINSVDPSDVHLALMLKGIIPDPFFGENEKKVQWVGETDWCFRTTFNVPANLLGQEEVNLVFDGLDTYAHVWLNDSLVLHADNMFRKWVIPVKTVLKKENNRLRICFSSPLQINKTKVHQYGIPLPEERAFTRKAPYQFGWDWGPTLITMGIWKPVYMEAWSGAKLSEVFIDQQMVTDTVAQVLVRGTIESTQPHKVKLTVSLNGEVKANKLIELLAGANNFQLPITIYEPTLWSPNGMGNPEMNAFTVVMDDGQESSIKVVTGLRKIELIEDRDEQGAGFFFKVNNQTVYVKGANYIPQDNFLTRVTREQTRDLLVMAKQSNINMLRVWGGGVYETDDFYELCDSLGIMIWQDFMFAGTVYPGDSAFEENVAQEAKEQVIRLRNHPCLALWCGNNEVDEAWHNWGWQKSLGYSAADSTKLWDDYLHLFEGILPRIVRTYAPHTDYVPSSPANGWGREKAYKQGDVHYWGVWWGEEPFENYNEKVGRFVSEYGFQGMPDPKTIDSFTSPTDRNLDSEVMDAHQKHPRGKELIQEYMERDFLVPDNFNDYIYVSQLLQARGIKMAIEAHRRARPFNMGTLYWQLNDCWPVTSWSGIDYNHRWKAMQYAVKDAYGRFLVSYTEENDSLNIWVVSDCFVDRIPEVRWNLITFEGDTLDVGKTSFSLPAGSSVKAARLCIKDLIGTGLRKKRVVLKASVWDGQELLIEGLHYFDKPKNLMLDATPSLMLEVEKVSDGYFITLTTRHLAKNVWIQSALDGQWSDNFFDVLPGDRVRVTFMSDTTKPPVFTLRSLGELN